MKASEIIEELLEVIRLMEDDRCPAEYRAETRRMAYEFLKEGGKDDEA